VGKSRLALRAAADLQRDLADGVWYVDLAPLTDPELLANTVAAALGIRDQSASGIATVLSEYLADKQLLLVLDNCEHVLEACAALTDSLLRAAPGLRILATSRQSLGIPGEQLMVVPPLSTPDPDRPSLPVAEVAAYDAVALFTERATAVSPGFRITSDNAPTVARICAMLDGMPLAIELAAVRLRSLSVEQIVERLADRFQLLTGGSRTASPRQRTLRALIYWSYELCTPEERTLWARASVFAGSFDLEAAEAVCTGADLPVELVLETLDGLIDKSIINVTEQDGRIRYTMTRTVRAFGLESLATSGEQVPTSRRHRDYFAGLAAQANEHWFGRDQLSWFGRLRTEQANFRAALEFCLTEPDEVATGLALATDLWPVWIAGGQLSEGRHWLGQMLERAPEPTPTRATALWVAAWATALQEDFAAALSLLFECRAIAQQYGDAFTGAYADQVAGLAAMMQGDLHQGVSTLEQALAGHRAARNPEGEAYAIFLLAAATSYLGDAERTIGLCEEGLAVSEAHGESWSRSWTTWVLAFEYIRQGDHNRAAALARESLQLKRAFDDRIGIGTSLELLAWAAAAGGQHERAAVLLGSANEIRRTLGEPLPLVLQDGHARCEATLRQQLGDDSFEAAHLRGSEFSFEQAVSYALEPAPAV
jgi:predicted ATPase